MRHVDRLLAVMCVGVMLVLGAHFLGQVTGRQDRTFASQCHRGNLVRGYLLLRARFVLTSHDRTRDIAPRIFRLVDCGRSRTGLEVPMSLVAQEAYLATLLAHHVPRG